MKIAFLSYPMLLQNQGGLQLQVQETLNALQEMGVDAAMFDYLRDDLNDFNIAHVFSINHGNYHLIQTAKEKGLKVVTSPLLPTTWKKNQAASSRLLDRLIRKFSGWHVKTEYSLDQLSLNDSDHIVLLGEAEKRSAIIGFNQPEAKMSIVPNGVSAAFNEADKVLFLEKFPHLKTKPIILNVASVNTRKNQLALCEATKNLNVHLVLIGPCTENNKEYLQSILKYGNVTYLGPLPYNDKVLVSAYAAAAVFCLPSIQEVLPISIYESLAAGTPAVFTNNCAVSFSNHDNVCWSKVRPTSVNDIQVKLEELLRIAKQKDKCKGLAAGYTWHNVATRIKKIYSELMQE